MLRRGGELLGGRPGVLAVERSMLGVYGTLSVAGLVLPVAARRIPRTLRILRAVQAQGGVFLAVRGWGGLLLGALLLGARLVGRQVLGRHMLGFARRSAVRLVFPPLETLGARRPSRWISGPPCRISVLGS